MTVAELIDSVLDAIWRQFDCYRNRVREFHRDRRALMKAIARVGYACEQNGWQLDAVECLKVVMTVLIDIRRHQEDVKYLPVYLDAAIGKHLREKAEEYSEREKRRGPRQTAALARESVAGLTVVTAVTEKTAMETLSELYVALRRARRKKAAVREKQKELL
jgi:hypothetical protein